MIEKCIRVGELIGNEEVIHYVDKQDAGKQHPISCCGRTIYANWLVDYHWKVDCPICSLIHKNEFPQIEVKSPQKIELYTPERLKVIDEK